MEFKKGAMNKSLFSYIGFGLLMMACKGDPSVKDLGAAISTSQNALNVGSPLQEGEFLLDHTVFGSTIELTGTCHPIDNFFKVLELEMIANDSLLIVKNRNEENMFMVYSLPDFNFIRSFGTIGNGPDEFQFPRLVKSNDPKVLCYTQEWRKNTLFALNSSFKFTKLPVHIQFSSVDRQICSVSDSNLFIVSYNEGRKSINQLRILPDTSISNFIYNLNFSNNLKSWTSYEGDFALNSNLNRIVFAYKYFKRIVFIDIVNKKSRIVKFNEQNSEADLKNNPLGPANTTYYWGLSSNNKYVYLLYSGRTPVNVSEELRKGPGYIYVEQFDWNGNPIRKFKLDHWGYFCVSADEKTIYLASITEEQPFYTYIIPEF